MVTQAGGSSRKHRGKVSRNSAHLKHSNSCPRSSNSKTLQFPSTFIKYGMRVKNWNRMKNAAALGGGGGGILAM